MVCDHPVVRRDIVWPICLLSTWSAKFFPRKDDHRRTDIVLGHVTANKYFIDHAKQRYGVFEK